MVENGRLMEHLTFQRGCQAITRSHKARDGATISHTGQSQSLGKHRGKHRHHTRSIVVEYVYMHPGIWKKCYSTFVLSPWLFENIKKKKKFPKRYQVWCLENAFVCEEKLCKTWTLAVDTVFYFIFFHMESHSKGIFNSTTPLLDILCYSNHRHSLVYRVKWMMTHTCSLSLPYVTSEHTFLPSSTLAISIQVFYGPFHLLAREKGRCRTSKWFHTSANILSKINK